MFIPYINNVYTMFWIISERKCSNYGLNLCLNHKHILFKIFDDYYAIIAFFRFFAWYLPVDMF